TQQTAVAPLPPDKVADRNRAKAEGQFTRDTGFAYNKLADAFDTVTEERFKTRLLDGMRITHETYKDRLALMANPQGQKSNTAAVRRRQESIAQNGGEFYVSRSPKAFLSDEGAARFAARDEHTSA